MDLQQQLEQYVKKVKDRYESCRGNEAATKAALIAPLFGLLGYDITDPREWRPEYKADWGKGRSKDAVDWAFFVNDSRDSRDSHPAFLVEAKAVGQNIADYDEQLGEYFGQEQPGVVLGILTTGVQWRFFTDLDCQHVMDKESFLEWDVLKGPPPYDFLTILQRAKFNPDLIKTFANGKHRQTLLVVELSAILTPSPAFVKLALENLEDRNLTDKVVEEWRPILVNAIQEWAQQQRLDSSVESPMRRTSDSSPVGRSPGCRIFGKYATGTTLPFPFSVSDTL
jgi:hypothetical protein